MTTPSSAFEKSLLTLQRSRMSQYGFAFLVSLVGLIFLHVQSPLFNQAPPLVTLTLSFAASAWWGGLGPGLFSTAFCCLATWYWLVPPEGWGLPAPGDQIRIAFTAISGIVISLFAWKTHATLLAVKVMANRMQEELEERHRVESVLEVQACELRRSETRLRAIFDNAALGIVEVDGQDRVTGANRRFLDLLGCSLEDLLGSSIHALTFPQDRTLSMDFHKRLHAGGHDIGDYEKRYMRRDGTPVWVHVTVAAVRDADGRFTGAVGTVEDITQRKRSEVDRERLLADLARSNNDLEQFASIVSHDLQEPLRMVTSFGQLLQQAQGDRLDGPARQYLDYMIEGAGRMSALVRGLLAYSRIRSGAGDMMEVNMDAVLGDVLDNLKMAIEAAGAVVDLSPLPTVLGNPTQLSQLFQNLIGNALKYHKPGATPLISICADRQGPDWFFSITDNGIGIDPQFHDRIFVLFQRLHTRDEYPGVGIGLSICKKIVERHGGRIWLESTPGVGTTFFFTLPVRKGDMEVPAAPAERELAGG